MIVLEQARELKGEAASPQLINNIAVLKHTKGVLPDAQLLYQSAWGASVKLGQEDASTETDDLLTTLSYNLGRLEEDANNIDEAKKTYEGLLKKHPDYVDGIPPARKPNRSRRAIGLPRRNRHVLRPILQTPQRTLTP
jgi:hypothetical protein